MTPKEVRKLWVEALESGEYKQGREFLCQRGDYGEVSFCCLGVLCDLAIKKEVVDYRWRFHPYLNYAEVNNRSDFCPPEVQEWAGLMSFDGEFSGGKSLADINDDSTDFSKVIEIIKSEPEGLFVKDEPVEVVSD